MTQTTLARHDPQDDSPKSPMTTFNRAPVAISETDTPRDCSGFAVFSNGDIGAMHVLAHDAFDEGNIERGHRVLGAWLASHSGSGSEWVHLQFHMAVFELALGDWDGAYARYVHEILPVAERTRLALTDAPALLWRLEIASPEHTRLPWQALRPMAISTISRSTDSFTTLHQLLVFAGTGDASLITAWQRSHRPHASSVSGHVLDRVATALACIARGNYAAAARRLSQVTPRLPLIGGSAAQNDLFRQLEQWCRQRSPSAAAMRPLGLAA